MQEHIVQLADGSYRPIHHTNLCSMCNKRYLRDEAKDRGKGIILCDDCARSSNTNFCRICHIPVPFEYNGIPILRCLKCRNRRSKEDKEILLDRKILADVVENVPSEFLLICVSLLRISDMQQAGLFPVTPLTRKEKKCRCKRWRIKTWLPVWISRKARK